MYNVGYFVKNNHPAVQRFPEASAEILDCAKMISRQKVFLDRFLTIEIFIQNYLYCTGTYLCLFKYYEQEDRNPTYN